MVPKNAQVSDLLEALQKKANISDETMQKVRAYEAHLHKFHKALPLDYQILSLHDYTQVYVAPYPDEDASKKITAFHFDKEPSKPHGVPFQLALKEVRLDLANGCSRVYTDVAQGEPFHETKQRLSDVTKIKGKQLDKIKFALVSRTQYTRPEYIEDGKLMTAFNCRNRLLTITDDVLWDLTGGRDDIALGLDHPNKSKSFWGKSDSIFIR